VGHHLAVGVGTGDLGEDQLLAAAAPAVSSTDAIAPPWK